LLILALLASFVATTTAGDIQKKTMTAGCSSHWTQPIRLFVVSVIMALLGWVDLKTNPN
jgi:hypothetical protein